MAARTAADAVTVAEADTPAIDNVPSPATATVTYVTSDPDTVAVGDNNGHNAFLIATLIRTYTDFLRPVVNKGLTVLRHIVVANVDEFGDINDKVVGTETLPGSRSHHNFVTPPLPPGVGARKQLIARQQLDLWKGAGKTEVWVRELSCSCSSCNNVEYDSCSRKRIVGTFESHFLKWEISTSK